MGRGGRHTAAAHRINNLPVLCCAVTIDFVCVCGGCAGWGWGVGVGVGWRCVRVRVCNK